MATAKSMLSLLLAGAGSQWRARKPEDTTGHGVSCANVSWPEIEGCARRAWGQA